MYHDRFSTSSYFMPSLYFKAHDVFAMSHSLNPHLIQIEVERLASTSSSDLVQRIIDKKADLVAVWDGTKKKFENDSRHPVHPDPDRGAERFSRRLRHQRPDPAGDRRRDQERPRRRPAVHRFAGIRRVAASGAQAASAVRERDRQAAERRLRRVVRLGQQRQRRDRPGARGAGEAAAGRASAADPGGREGRRQPPGRGRTGFWIPTSAPPRRPSGCPEPSSSSRTATCTSVST